MVATSALIALAGTRLKYLAKIRDVVIDNWAFSLHYRFGTMMLLLLSVFVTCNQFFGEPISCIKNSDIDLRIINSYCWVEGTFTLPKALLRQIEIESRNYTGLLKGQVGPGIEKRILSQDDVLAQNYYYWVSLVLFFQACAFFVTHLLWKTWEGNHMRHLIQDLNKCVLPEKTKNSNAEKVVGFVYQRLGYYNTYAFRFLLCEALNVMHVLAEIKLTDVFLQGEFVTYGWNMLFSNDFDVSPTGRVFPKLAKCTFNRFGPSGDVQVYDNLCLLPLNILNEKIYFFVWLLFAGLLVSSVLAFIYRVAVIAVPSARYYLLKFYNRNVDDHFFHTILEHCSYGDWFLLYLLSRNVDPMHYSDVVSLLAHRLENRLPISITESSTLRQK